MEKLLREGQIISIKIGRLRRIPADELDRFIARQLEAQGGVQESR
jgi:excisionase family DNA binding protein